MTEAEAIARRLFNKHLVRPDADLDEVTAIIEAVQDEDLPHYVIYYMGTDEVGSTLYDSHAECVEDCETEMIPVPVYGIPRPDPEEGGEGAP